MDSPPKNLRRVGILLLMAFGVLLLGISNFKVSTPSPAGKYTPHKELVGMSFTTERDGVLRLNILEGKTTELMLIEHSGELLEGDVSVASGTDLKIQGVRKVVKSSKIQLAVLIGEIESGPVNSRHTFEYQLGEYRPPSGEVFGDAFDNHAWILPPAIWETSKATTFVSF